MTSGVILRKDSEEVNVEKNKLDVIAIIPIRIFFKGWRNTVYLLMSVWLCLYLAMQCLTLHLFICFFWSTVKCVQYMIYLNVNIFQWLKRFKAEGESLSMPIILHLKSWHKISEHTSKMKSNELSVDLRNWIVVRHKRVQKILAPLKILMSTMASIIW